jgi:nicotinamidase-related amidase
MNIALLIIDIQKAFIGELKNERVYSDTLAYINATAQLFRKSNHQVYVIRDIEEGDGDEYQNVEELLKDPNDIEVLKVHSNSFWQTDLDTKLREKKIDFLVLCGNAAEYCVLATFNGAKERGYGAAILQHGVFSNHPNGLMDLYLNRPLISYEVIKHVLL